MNRGFWLALGGLGGGISVGLALRKLSHAGYKNGLGGEELVWTGPLGIIGRTFDGSLVLVSSFENGSRERKLHLALGALSAKVNELERRNYVTKKRLNEITGEIKNLWAQISDISELREKLKDLHYRIMRLKIIDLETT